MVSNGEVKAVVLDLDGVVVFTAGVHAAAWKELFDAFLRERSARRREAFSPFDIQSDYSRYVDGKPRLDGIVSFLSSRGITLPRGSASDLAGTLTVWGLGIKKNQIFRSRLEQLGVDVDQQAVRFVRELRAIEVRTGLASSSKNAPLILERAGLSNLFETVVDGVVSESLGIPGKPEPDIFLECLRRLDSHVRPRDAAVVEDAISGVEAGRKGGFGLVLGVDRQDSGELQNHGANWVIRNFDGFTAGRFLEVFHSRPRAA